MSHPFRHRREPTPSSNQLRAIVGAKSGQCGFRPRACRFVFLHPLEHTQTKSPLHRKHLPLPKVWEKLTSFREQQRHIGQRTAPSWSITPSSYSKNQLFHRVGCGTSEWSINSIDMIFMVCSCGEGILSRRAGSHRLEIRY